MTWSLHQLTAQKQGLANKTHGEASLRTAEYRSWASAKNRCTNPKNDAYYKYGGRGLTMCARWLNSYEAFLADMGRRPSKSHSLDRIDNDKGYSPSNCRWATAAEQANNRHYGNRWITWHN